MMYWTNFNNSRLFHFITAKTPLTFQLLILMFTVSLTGKAQIPNGAWRDHLPYNDGKRLAEGGNKIFCSTSGGALFSFNVQDNSID